MKIQAAFWSNCVTTARSAGLGRPDYVEVRFESLIMNPIETLKAVCQFIDLDCETAMLDYYKRAPVRLREHRGRLLPSGKQVLTDRQRLVQQQATMTPPDPRRVFGWKRAMNPGDRKDFEMVAGGLLRDLGYEV